MKKVIEVLVLFLCVLAIVGCGKVATVENANPNVQHEGLYVDGKVLRNASGEEFVMRGINHGHNWYPDFDKVAFDAIEATGSNCIRIVLATGRRWEKDDAASVKRMIEEARKRGMVSIVEVHDATGSDDIAVITEMAEYWAEMASVLAGTENYCILNIANEWCGSWNSRRWMKGYVKAIPIIREAGIKNCIQIDSAGWGQWGLSSNLYGVKVFESDILKNTMFSVHMYGCSGRWEWLIRFNLDGVRKHNLCVCVGEFGWTHSDGDVKEDYMMQYCEEQGIGYIAWSWKGNTGGVEYLDLAEEWDGSKLSEWGDKVVNGPYGIRKTSKKMEL